MSFIIGASHVIASPGPKWHLNLDPSYFTGNHSHLINVNEHITTLIIGYKYLSLYDTYFSYFESHPINLHVF